MTTFNYQGFSFSQDASGISNFAEITFSIVMAQGVNTVSYFYDEPQVAGQSTSVELNNLGTEVYGLMLDGVPNFDPTRNGFVEEITWGGGNSAYILVFDLNSGGQTVVVQIGGDPLSFANATELEDFIATSDSGDVPPGGIYSAGAPIDLTAIAGVTLTEDDYIVSDDSAHDFEGGAGADTMEGNGGNDTLSAGIGNDSVDAGAGNDSVDGGGGFDTITGGAGDDTLLGGTGADSLMGGDDDDRIEGGDGFDWLFGDAGNDTLIAGATADRAYGGDGNDFIRGGSNLGLTVDGLFGGNGDDTILGEGGYDHLEGGAGNDLLDGGHQADNLYGQAGNDTLLGDLGLDRLFGGAGDDSASGGDGNDGLFGDHGNDTLEGDAGNDRFFGGQGNDLIDGGGDDDSIYGGSGFDTITGGTGNDLMQGDFNADTFVFVDGHGEDTISDFDATNNFEVIDLSGHSAFNSFADVQAALIVLTDSVVIDTGMGGHSITLMGIDVNDLDANDFVF